MNAPQPTTMPWWKIGAAALLLAAAVGFVVLAALVWRRDIAVGLIAAAAAGWTGTALWKRWRRPRMHNQ